MNKKDLLREIVRFTFRVRQFNNKCLKTFAKNVKKKRVLELGSGKKYKGGHYYSAKQFFDDSNQFIQSDVIPEYGHNVIDATKMSYANEFDVILCMNVLEHIFDFQKAIENIYIALKPSGTAIIFVPVFYPLHDEPSDYWRFTEHSIKKLLQNFRTVVIKHSGIRQYPFSYYIEATK